MRHHDGRAQKTFYNDKLGHLFKHHCQILDSDIVTMPFILLTLQN